MLRLMSQNQWNYTNNCEVWQSLGLDCSSPVRMKGHVQVFKDLAPDVVGGQEVNKEMQLDFMLYCQAEKLPYTILWGNMTPIFYRADKLEVLATEYLLYPKKFEDYEGSFNDSNSKACNLAVFREKASGKVFIFATTHLWWRNGTNPDYKFYQAGSDAARAYQLGLADAMIEKYRAMYDNCPVVLVGDMNARLGTPALNYALGEGGYTHAHDVATEFAHEGRGYCACTPRGPADKWLDGTPADAIDHILVKGLPAGAVKRFDRYTPEYYLKLSDHAPVFVDVEL
ncbi:MAG: endonuclease/exonuclease/phosphatase family protein [Clostridia bacterium]|nr:endonuclease/exonuclease/phosphatase family protein [Clostridia bacterium]